MIKPIIVVKICYKLLYVIQVVKKIFISNFLASADIKAHTNLQNCFMVIRVKIPECVKYSKATKNFLP